MRSERSLCLPTATMGEERKKKNPSIMNHLFGPVPPSRERLQRRKRKTSVREGRHVRGASVALESFSAEIT